MNKEWEKEFAKIINDPWYFASKCVLTLDQSDKINPKKRFPKEKEYLKYYTRVWQKYDFVAVPKSRRMFMSWMNIILYLHDTMFHKGRFQAFVSKKEEDANELIKKAKFIIDNISELDLPKELIPKHNIKYCSLSFPELDSEIRAFPSGSDQLRQFTFSGILGDEMAFWDNSQEMYSSAIPTIEGGGRFTAISSPAPGFFKKIVFDKIDDNMDPGDDVVQRPDSWKPLKGLEVWQNPKNKFAVFQTHYTADPMKCEPGYIDRVKSSMPHAQFMREYMLSWNVYEGMPVYQDFDKDVHGVDKLEPEAGLPLLLGWDFGLTPACVICQMQDDTFCVLEEIIGVNIGIDRFSDRVIRHLRTFYPNWSGLRDSTPSWIDPSGFARKDTDETTCAKILQSKGFNCRPGPVPFEPRRTAVEKFLTTRYRRQNCFKINLSKAPVTARGFLGEYRYPEKVFEVEARKPRPIKDETSHPHDALQYVAWGAGTLTKKNRKRHIPSPSYNWGR